VSYEWSEGFKSPALQNRGQGTQIRLTSLRLGHPSLASSISFRTEELLGLVMAHEVGHLLLGTNAHSNQGIMRATWRRRHLDARDWEEFEFTQVQTKRLRAAVLSRMSPEEQSAR
jgi:hypothetical protein